MKTGFLLLSVLFALSANANTIVASDAWIRSAPPNAPALGLFMQIHNHSDKENKLIAVKIKGYERIEMHRTMNDGGIMRMLKQDFMPVSARAMLNLKPGGWHIMLIRPTRVPSKGEKVSIELQFDNGTSQTLDAEVRTGHGAAHQHEH